MCYSSRGDKALAEEYMIEKIKNILANRKVLIPAAIVLIVVALSVLLVAGRP